MSRMRHLDTRFIVILCIVIALLSLILYGRWSINEALTDKEQTSQFERSSLGKIAKKSDSKVRAVLKTDDKEAQLKNADDVKYRIYLSEEVKEAEKELSASIESLEMDIKDKELNARDTLYLGMLYEAKRELKEASYIPLYRKDKLSAIGEVMAKMESVQAILMDVQLATLSEQEAKDLD